MKKLEQVHLVQFFLFEAQAFDFRGHCAFIGPNGAGKTSVLDAVQLALMGTNMNHIQLNSQKDDGGRDRTIREYCLGKLDETYKREHATSYITLVFRDEQTGQAVSAGVCISASIGDTTHEVQGLYVIEGLAVRLSDHLETQPNGQAPFAFSDFKASVEAQCRAMPVKPRAMFFKEREKTAYVEQLVRTLSGKQWINAKDFMRAFHRAVLLRHRESVDEFVRRFLVESEPVDKSAAAAQVEDFKRMNLLVEATGRKISDLTGLEKNYRDVERLSQQATSLKGLALSLEVEHLCALNIEDEDRIVALQKDIAKAIQQAEQSGKLIQELDAQLVIVQTSMKDDGPNQRREALKATIRGAEQLLSQIGSSILFRLSRWEQALQSAKSFPQLEAQRETIDQRIEALQASRYDLQSAQPSLDIAGAAEEATRVLREVAHLIQSESDRAATEAQSAAAAVEAAKTAKDALARTGVLLTGEYAKGYTRLLKNGIEPKPVCSLVTVRNKEWQAAIESYLKGNRFAFVVPHDVESRAVDYLDDGPHGERIYGVKIVRSKMIPAGYRPPQDLVASEFQGDATAVGFLHEQVGNLKKIDRKGLDSEPNGLTATGGLNKSRSTTWLPMLRPGQLAFGRTVEDSLGEADQQVKDAEAWLVRATTTRNNLLALLKNLNLAAGDEEEALRFKADLKQAQDYRGALADNQATMGAIDVGHLDTLFARQQELEERKAALTTAVGEANQRSGIAKGHVQESQRRIEDRNKTLAVVQQEEKRQREHVDFDPAYCDEKRQEYTEPKDGVVLAHEVVISNIRTAAENRYKRLNDKAKPIAQDAFRTFLDRYAEYVLLEERSDWRKALLFISAEKKTLVESTLVQYQKQLELAMQAAEEGFRAGVAIRIRSAIEKMRRHIRELNNLLSTCTFTNGEVYRFSQAVVPEHKEFLDYFEACGTESAEFSLFGGSTNIGRRVLELLAESSQEGKAKVDNILDDYRLMFTFDVDILVNNVKVNKLSNRIGPGSGGEHRAPFYVIAGAALARAYRTDEGANRSGVAIMLLDEAFGKMDDQNSIAATEFLERQGLQLIMTAPNADRAKMSAVSDTIFEFMRLGKSIRVRPVGITEKGKQLMRSDQHALNPHLVERQLALVQQELADAPARA